MQFIEDLDKETYDNFVLNHPTKSHFMQSYAWGEVNKYKNFIPHYVGIKENNKLIATALILKKRLPLGYSYFYIPRGYVMDFDNLDVLNFITKEIKKYALKNKAIFIKIDPDLKLHDLDEEGNIIENNHNNQPLIDNLISLGYKHKGFNKNFENSQPRYTFRLDLTSSLENIRKGMHSTTRKILNRNNPYNLKINIGNEKDIKKFFDLMKITSNRDNFVNSQYEYYYHFYNTLNKYKMTDLMFIEVSGKDIINKTKEMINESNKELLTVKNEGKKQDLLLKIKKLENNLTEYETYNNIYPDKVIISSVITVKYGDKVWTVHGGNHDIYRSLDANYLLYYEILVKAKNEGYKIIDFFGTTGNPTLDNKIYGIHLFKKRFGGEYIEFIGEFDLVTNKPMYLIFTKLIPFYRKIMKRIINIKNKQTK